MSHVIKFDLEDELFSLLEELANDDDRKPGVYAKRIIVKFLADKWQELHGYRENTYTAPENKDPRKSRARKTETQESTNPGTTDPVTEKIRAAMANPTPAFKPPTMADVPPPVGQRPGDGFLPWEQPQPLAKVYEKPPGGWWYDHDRGVWIDSQGTPQEYGYQRFGTPTKD